MSHHFEKNRALWDAWTEVHRNSDFYDVDGFREGELSLKSIEREALGDVAGKRLLHLQCHFGLDTLSWARLGAEVTGVDFSERAITLARSLARQLDIDARLLRANIYDLPEILDDEFDIVFASYGVLAWLPDLDRWMEIATRYLRSGGTFFLAEFHPVACMLDDRGERLVHPYFHSPEAVRYAIEGSYADPDADVTGEAFEWVHPLGDVVNAVLAGGLRLEEIREYPYSPYGCFPFLVEREPDRWRVEGAEPDLPLTFSLRATRQEREATDT